jgi:hypothetical protein
MVYLKEPRGYDFETTGFIEEMNAVRPAIATGEWSDVWARIQKPETDPALKDAEA